MSSPAVAAVVSALTAVDSVAPTLLSGLLQNALYATILYGALWLTLQAGGAARRWLVRRTVGQGQASSPLSPLPPTAELLFWALVLVRLILPPDLAAPWSLRSGLELVASTGESGKVASGELIDSLFDLGAVLGSTADPAGARRSHPGSTLWATGLLVAWFAGSGIALGRFARRRGWVRRRLGSARLPQGAAGEALAEATERWRGLLGIRRRVRVVVGEGPGSPFTIGVLRPVIWLPERLLADTRPRLAEVAVAHELHHVRGLDDLWLRLLAVVRALYFFLPVVWWASSRVVDCRERAVDDAVLVHEIVSPRAYGRALLAAGAPTWPTRPPRERFGRSERDDELPVPAFGTDRRSLPMRIERIARPTALRPSRRATLAASALALLLAVIALPMGALSTDGPGTASATPAGPDAPAATPDAETGAWTNPVAEARVTSPYGPRRNPVDARHRVKHHNGVDLAAPEGTPILAPAAGTVLTATETYRPNTEWGTVLVIDHGNGIQTRYAHLGTLEVREGQKVARGETVATVGTTGLTTGPHLHLEVLENGEPTDPARLVPGLEK